MKRIGNESSREEGQKRKQVILGVLLVLLMFGSVLGYALSLIGSKDSVGSTNLEDSSHIVNANGVQFSFIHSTNETRQVPIEGSFSGQDYVNKPVYIAASDIAVFQQIAAAASTQAERVQQACYGACEDQSLPEKTCADVLIVWTPSKTNRVYVNDSCVFIDGDSLAVEAFLYRFFGIS